MEQSSLVMRSREKSEPDPGDASVPHVDVSDPMILPCLCAKAGEPSWHAAPSQPSRGSRGKRFSQGRGLGGLTLLVRSL